MLVQGPTAKKQQSLLIFCQVDVNFIDQKTSNFGQAEPLRLGDGQIQHLHHKNHKNKCHLKEMSSTWTFIVTLLFAIQASTS